ncbi:MAG: hypothetical protein JWL95_3248 [Gemmatimonadetes bacterium]|nr:hypothetical protein [Gemmatimonadota bacterium]
MRGRRRNPPRSHGQMLALMVLAGVVSSVASVLVVEMLNRAREAAALRPLPQPVAPGHGSA